MQQRSLPSFPRHLQTKTRHRRGIPTRADRDNDTRAKRNEQFDSGSLDRWIFSQAINSNEEIFVAVIHLQSSLLLLGQVPVLRFTGTPSPSFLHRFHNIIPLEDYSPSVNRQRWPKDRRYGKWMKRGCVLVVASARRKCQALNEQESASAFRDPKAEAVAPKLEVDVKVAVDVVSDSGTSARGRVIVQVVSE